MVRCQRYELLALAAEERIRANDERTGAQCKDVRERGVDFAGVAGFEDSEPPSLGARRLLRVFDDALSTWIVRVHQQRDSPGLRNQLGKQFKAFRRQLVDEQAHPREVAARPGEAGDKA